MSSTIEKILSEINELPKVSKEILAEKILSSISQDYDPEIEKIQLDIVKKRRRDIINDQINPVDGEIGLQKARDLLHK